MLEALLPLEAWLGLSSKLTPTQDQQRSTAGVVACSIVLGFAFGLLRAEVFRPQGVWGDDEFHRLESDGGAG